MAHLQLNKEKLNKELAEMKRLQQEGGKAIENGDDEIFSKEDANTYRAMGVYDYLNGNVKAAYIYARRYIDLKTENLNLENLIDALMFVMGERQKILYYHQKPELSYIEQNVSKLLALYKMPYVEGEERILYYDDVAENAILLHAESLIEHERYEEAVEVLLSDTIGGYREVYNLFKIKKYLDLATYMNAALAFWKRVDDTQYSEEYRNQVMKGIEFILHRFKARNIQEYEHFISLGKAAGCKSIERP